MMPLFIKRSLTPGFGALRLAGSVLLLAFASCAERPGESADTSAIHSSDLDLSKPVPRDQVLNLFRRFFALPAEDYLNWNEAVEAGKIPSDVRAFHETILAFNKEASPPEDATSTEGLPSVEITDGITVFPPLKATLAPNLAANVSQEDLNTLLPDLVDLQKRILDHQARQAEAQAALFTPVNLGPEAFAIAQLHDAAGPGTVEKSGGANAPEGMTWHVSRIPGLDGRHVEGARISTEPFIGLRIFLSEAGARQLTAFTADNVGRAVAVLIDGEVHATVAIIEPIETRDLQLPGALSAEKAQAVLERWSR